MRYDNAIYEELNNTKERLQAKYNRDKESLEELRQTLDEQLNSLNGLKKLIQSIDESLVRFNTVKYIQDNDFIIYHYVLETDFAGTDSYGYLLVKRECEHEFDIDEYLSMEAKDNLESYGFITEEDYEFLQEELENVDEDYSIADYSYYYKEITIEEILNGGYNDFNYKKATIIS